MRKESVAFWDVQNSCTLEGFSFATWRMAAVCGDGDSCPQLSAWPPGLWECGTTQQRLCCATPLAIFPITSAFMCKAGKSRKGFSYLQVLEKWLLDFKMGLKTNLFLLLQNFSASADREPDPPTSLQVTALLVWTKSCWAVAGVWYGGALWLSTSCIAFSTFISPPSPSLLSQLMASVFFTTHRLFLGGFYGQTHGSQIQPQGSTAMNFLWIKFKWSSAPWLSHLQKEEKKINSEEPHASDKLYLHSWPDSKETICTQWTV